MKSKKLTLMQKRAIIGLVFISPWLVGFILYYLVSFIKTVQFALCSVNIGKAGGYTLAFKGLSNFKYALFTDAKFNQVLVDSISNMMVDVPLIIFFSLFMAIILNQKFKGRTIIRAIFFIPVIMNAGAINDALELARQLIAGGLSAVASEVGTTTNGLDANYLFDTFAQLGMPMSLIDYIIGAVSRTYDIVRASGVQIIIFLAALQSVPSSLYEVSKIEGATSYETFWKVTFPMVTPLILTNVVYTIVDSFTTSDVVDMAYKVAITDHKYGLSSAMSLLSTGVVGIILVIVGVLISKKTFYYN